MQRVVGGRSLRALTALALVSTLGAAAAGCKKGSSSGNDGGDGSMIMVEGGTEVRTDARDGGADMFVCPSVDAAQAIGATCACDAQCGSNHCVDGVCCSSACTEGCKTCASPAALGSCVNRAAGDPARDSTTCATMPASTCLTNGLCDGTGGCQKWPINTMCKPGTCEGDAVVGSYTCDGAGRCKSGSTVICVPFSCDPSTNNCVEICTSNNQCSAGQQCVSGSCGKRMKGATCRANGDCASNFCADGLCCNVACQGPCLACNLTGREGTCWPIDADKADPRGMCQDAGAFSCGQTGLCDGFGGCSKYPRDTKCTMPSCSGNIVNTPGTCDGLGTCSGPGVQPCHPFRCANGACTNSCVTNADCDTGIACVAGTCGLKQDGQSCKDASECQNSHCVDGVCCDQACTGACRSCAAGSMAGHCMPIAAGTVDPRGMCAALAQSTCGTNGKCDGNGGCQIWPVGTLCADETCNPTGNIYKAPSTCNASGQCGAPELVACSPYTCNSARCFNACTNDSQCVSPNTCINNSCGLKEPGGSCSGPDECRSKFCAQGVCCDQACDSACKSCIAGTPGICTDVTNGAPDPTGKCLVQDPMMCGTNGKCQAGACQKYPTGTPCMPATCPTASNLFTALSTCDGSGTCQVPATTTCFPYRCGTAACKASCTADADCLAPATCSGGSCGLKPAGSVCASKDECLSNFCDQGLCCQTACTGICKSCALSTSRGVCSNIPNGTADITSRCSDQGGPSCSTDGFCDGNGACRLYGAGTTCAAATCGSGQSTQINARACDGLGVCQPATTKACAPYVCNGSTACLGTCSGDQDCLPPNICDPKTSHCGNQKRLGQACTTNSDCLTGNFCVNGVCCSTSACALCQSCNVGTAAGNCANIPAGTSDSRCTPNPPCGNTGACNGNGVCQLAATTASCGTQSCSGSTFTPLSHCNGSGGCLAPTASSCSPYLCGGDTCRNTCSMDTQCLSPYTCQGTPPNRNCALKPNGTVCTAGNQCGSGSCVDGVCCGLPPGSTSCGTCQTCNAGTPGTCTALIAGTPAPSGQCAASPPCGNTGTCNGSSGCTQAATTVSCGTAVACTGATFQPQSFCTGAGACNQLPTNSCGNYICGTNSCRTNCNSDAHCSSTSLYCTGNATTAGSCVAKKANGAACGGGNECATGNCVDGVCCATSSCAACQSCSLNGNGTCANVPAGMADPPNCAANPPCGNTGFCNGAGACEQGSTSIKCGLAAACNGTTFQPISHCSGSGTCTQTSTSDCGAYQCDVNNAICKSSCTGDTDCTGAYYCAGGTCTAKKGMGASCGAGNQCVSGNCIDGSCCASASCPTCQSCGLNGLGTCANVGSGTTDPHGRCLNTGPCGNTGACNGGGACQQQPSTLQCGAAVMCVGSTYQPPSFCNGTGNCSQLPTNSCGNYVCNQTGTACLTSCNNDDSNCIAGSYCTGPNGSCQPKKSPPSACSAAHECANGNCVDGVCCNTSTCGTCRTCNGTTPGTCAAVADGQAEPHNLCAATPPCGNTGFCASGACAQVNAGTMCTSFTCLGATTFQPAGACNGTGTCMIPNAVDCSPFQCTTGSCRSTCEIANEKTECVQPGAYCNGTSCVAKKGAGTACGRDGECGSGHCTEGVCCNLGACPQCQSCVVPLNEGLCTNLPAHAIDPTGSCQVQGAASCGTNGRCNGAGNCELYDMSTVCNTTCVSPTFTTFSCDGLGLCSVLQPQICSSLTCDANGCLP